jgi:hypothetical protein
MHNKYGFTNGQLKLYTVFKGEIFRKDEILHLGEVQGWGMAILY